MSLETGQYRLTCYDDKGRRDRRFEHATGTLTEAVKLGESMVTAGNIASFAVDRRLYNSLDTRRERWEGKA